MSVLPVVQEFYRLVEQNEPLSGISGRHQLRARQLAAGGRFVAAAFVSLDEQAREGEAWVRHPRRADDRRQRPHRAPLRIPQPALGVTREADGIKTFERSAGPSPPGW